MKTIYNYEAFDDRYTVVVSPTQETTVTSLGNEIDIISLENRDIAIQYDEEHPNTVWTVIRNDNTDEYDTEVDDDDESFETDDDDSDYDDSYTPVIDDIEEDEYETFAIVPGIEEINAIFFIVTETPYDDDEVIHQQIEFDA